MFKRQTLLVLTCNAKFSTRHMPHLLISTYSTNIYAPFTICVMDFDEQGA